MVENLEKPDPVRAKRPYIPLLSFSKALNRKLELLKKSLSFFKIEHEKGTNLWKMYSFAKIYKRLYDIPGRPMISNFETPAEKASEVLDNQLKDTQKVFDDFKNKQKSV